MLINSVPTAKLNTLRKHTNSESLILKLKVKNINDLAGGELLQKFVDLRWCLVERRHFFIAPGVEMLYRFRDV